MEKQLFETEPNNNRAALLADNAVRVEDEKVKRYFTAEETVELKDQLATISIKEREAEQIKAEAMKTYNANIKILATQRTEAMKKLKDGSYESLEKVYFFDYQDEGLMGIYDSKGELIYSRKLLPDEKQVREVRLLNAK